jgi:hypothetical protein
MPHIGQNGYDQDIVYDNTLLGAMHPERSFVIFNHQDLVLLPSSSEAINAINEVKTVDNVPYKFDFCGGSRKKGDCIYSDRDKHISDLYFKTEAKAISHGSILLTACYNGMFEVNNLRVVVLDDTDPIFQSLGINDCFGLCSQQLANELGTKGRQFQFRAGVASQWIAKGTLLPADIESMDVDLILPLSSFKGHHPTTGMRLTYKQLFLGVHSIPRPKQMAKFGFSILQWFTSEAAKAHVLNCTEQALDQLLEARKNVGECVKQLRLEATEIDVESDNSSDDYDYAYMDRILTAPVANQVFHHPKVIEYINQRWAKKYRQTTFSAGLKGHYQLAAPMPQLPPGIVLSQTLAPGNYIMVRYPVRGRIDIRQVEVLNEAQGSQYIQDWDCFADKQFNQYTGSFFINPAFFAEVGGDFDGDCAMFLNAQEHLPLFNEIPEWTIKTPPVKEKKPFNGSKAEVALRSFSNMTGLVSNINARRWLLGWTSFKGVDLDIKLADELQKAVDSFKSNELIDEQFLDDLSSAMLDTTGDAMYWLDQYKSRTLFLTEGMLPEIQYTDGLICQMALLANGKWNPLSWKSVDASHFRYLFDHIPGDVPEATTWYQTHSRTVVNIFEDKDSSQDWKMACYADTMRQAKRVINSLSPDERVLWAASAWRAAHIDKMAVNNQRASLCWYCFESEILEALSELRLQKFMGFIPKALAEQGYRLDPTSLQPGIFKVDWSEGYLSLYNQRNEYVLSVSTSKSKTYQVPWAGTFQVADIRECRSKDNTRIVGYEFAVAAA